MPTRIKNGLSTRPAICGSKASANSIATGSTVRGARYVWIAGTGTYVVTGNSPRGLR